MSSGNIQVKEETKLVFLLAITIFMVEFFVMLVIERFPTYPVLLRIVLDASILVFLVSPLLLIPKMRVEESKRRIKRLYSILEAIRDVNRLISRESNIEKMLYRVCKILRDVREYFYVTIVLYTGKIVKIAEDGTGGFFEICEEVPSCVMRAIETQNPVIFDDTKEHCGKCRYYRKDVNYSAAIVPFKTSMGKMLLAVFANINHFDEEEKELLRDVANDIGFAVDKYIAEDELRCSEERYRTTFEHTGTAMAIIERDLTISLVNSEFENLSGYSKKEIEGKMSCMDFIYPEDSEKVMNCLNSLQKSRKMLKKYEFRFIDRKRNVKNIFLSVDSIQNGRYVASLMNITRIKRLNSLLECLSEINEIVARGNNPKFLLKTVCEKLRIVYDAVFTTLRKDGGLIPVRSEGIGPESIKKAIKHCPSISNALEGKITKMKMNDELCKHCMSKKHKYVLSIPLSHNRIYGVITIHSGSEFNPDEITLLEKLSKNIAFASVPMKLKKTERERLTSSQLI